MRRHRRRNRPRNWGVIVVFVSLVGLSWWPSVALAAPTAASTTTLPDWPELFLTQIVDGGLANPTFVTHAGDGSDRLFITEKQGRILIVEDGQLLATPFLDISDRTADYSECGLLSVIFPADYAEQGYFLVYYNYDVGALGDLVPPERPDIPNDGCDTVVARFRVTDDPNVADPDSEERLLTQNQPYGNHDGGQMAYGPDGYVYIGLGDGGSGGDPHNLAQDPAILLGKMLRLDIGATGPYTVPADNPFVGQDEFRPEIWAVGLRNPWRFSFDRGAGDLFIADVGQSNREEIDVQPASSTGGENYGWNIMEGLHCYPAIVACDTDGYTLPVLEYGRTEGQAVTGGYVYRGPTYPRMAGVYFFGDYVNGRIWGLRRDGADWVSQLLLETGWAGRLASFGEDEAGEIYVVDLNGALYRLGDTLQVADLPARAFLPLMVKSP
ncbi:MAG: PQQ-dependent sugar dehydrogenase [Caldilineaceae bacterium]|nr:PQQ-dependent sugar dehydrogenase [Caldilineaceae bacterium]